MKYIKTYENISEPQIGDYVICKDTTVILNFLDKNIGQIVRYVKDDDIVIVGYRYMVKYENIPEDIRKYFNHYENDDSTIKEVRPFSRDEILYHSKNKEELERILVAKKYNL